MSDAVPNPTPEVCDSQDQAKETPPEETKKETTNTENDEQKDRRNKNAKPRREGDDQTAENEIRVAAKGQIKNYLGYAFRILNKTHHKSLTIRATGNAIVKALILIELVKRRVGDLHQKNRIYSLEIKSEEESKIPEGMVQDKEKTIAIRRVTAMDTELSKDPLDTTDPGYQSPLPKEEKPEPSKDKEEGEKKQKSGKQNKPHKSNNTPIDGEEEKQAANKQRRGRDNKHGKHEDDQDNNQPKKDNEGKKKVKKEKDTLKGEDQGDMKDQLKEDQKQKKKQNRNKFKQNLRNIIDDEDPSKRRLARGGGDRMRHPRGDRGDGRRGYQGGYNQMHNNYGAPMHAEPFDQNGPRQGRDRRYYRRGNDDFGIQPREERRGPAGQFNNHQGANYRQNPYNNYEQNNEYNDRQQYRHPRQQQFMYNDGGRGPAGRQEPYYGDDRNHHRDEPHQFRGGDDQRISRGQRIMREPREGVRPQYEMAPRDYDRERVDRGRGGGHDFEEETGRQALSGHRGRGRGDRGGYERRNHADGDHEENQFNDHRGNRGGIRGDRGGFRRDRGAFRGDRGAFRGDRGSFRGDRGGDRGMEQRRMRGDHGEYRARGGGPGEINDTEHYNRGRGGGYEGRGGRGGNRQDRPDRYQEDESGSHNIHTKKPRGGHATNQETPQNASD